MTALGLVGTTETLEVPLVLLFTHKLQTDKKIAKCLILNHSESTSSCKKEKAPNGGLPGSVCGIGVKFTPLVHNGVEVGPVLGTVLGVVLGTTLGPVLGVDDGVELCPVPGPILGPVLGVLLGVDNGVELCPVPGMHQLPQLREQPRLLLAVSGHDRHNIL